MLTAFQCHTSNDFPDGVAGALIEAGYQVGERHYALEAWRPGLEWEVPRVGRVRGGCRLMKMTGGGGKWVAVLPHWGLPEIDLTPVQRAVVDKQVTASPEFSAAGRLAECKRLIEHLGFAPLPHLDPLSVAEASRLKLGSGLKALGAANHFDLKGRPLHTPTRRHLLITSRDHDEPGIKGFAHKITDLLAGFGVGVEVRQHGFSAFSKSLAASRPDTVKHQSIVLIGVPGSRADPQPVPPETLAALDRMDALGIPYRVFGDPSIRSRYAPNDMAPHLAMLMGASLKELVLPPAFNDTWFLGFDLGHPLHRGDTVPVLSVVDSRGRLLAWWRTRQIRDETLRLETTRRSTEWLLELMKTHGAPPENLVILRDGKLNRNDGLDEMTEMLPCPSTLIEVVKNPVPLVFIRDHSAPPGTWLEVDSGRDGFLQMPKPFVPEHIAHPLRLRKPRPRDRHELHDVAAAVFALCHAPTLGLRPPGSPAPIYWSDGLSANSGRDLQFRGLNHVPHHDEILGIERPPFGSETPAQK